MENSMATLNKDSKPNLNKRLLKEVQHMSNASCFSSSGREIMTVGGDGCGTAEELVMRNPLVLDCIFKNLDLSSIKTMRQVCKTWNESATSAMGKKSCISFKNQSKIKIFLKDKLPHQLVQNIDVQTVSILENPKGFFPKYGPTLSSLTATSVYLSDKMLQSILVEKCVNLKEIKLKDIYKNDPTPVNDFVFNRYLNLRRIRMVLNDEVDHNVLFRLLQSSPKLTHLHIEYKESIIIKSESGYAYAVDLKHLRALTIKCPGDGPGYSYGIQTSEVSRCEIFLKSLTDGLLKKVDNLTYLYLQTYGSVLRNLVPALVERFKNSLESLSLMDWSSFGNDRNAERNAMIDLPVLSNLKVFKVQSPSKLGINSLEFLNEKMPNLEILQILNGGWEINKLFGSPELETHESLKALSLGNQVEGLNHEETITSLRKMFPNVSTLDLSLSLEISGAVKVWINKLFRDYLAQWKLKKLSIGFDSTFGSKARIFTFLKGLKHLNELEFLIIRCGRGQHLLQGSLQVIKDIARDIRGLRKIIVVGATYTGTVSVLSDTLKICKNFGVEVDFCEEKNDGSKLHFCVDKPSYY